jgi:hypothetical protein
MAAKSLYGQEPSNMASYSFELLKVNRGALRPRDVSGLVRPEAAAILKNYKSTIERSHVDILRRNDEAPVRPYWDKTLAADSAERRRLLLHLASLRLVSFRRRVKAKAGLFFVKKQSRGRRSALGTDGGGF